METGVIKRLELAKGYGFIHALDADLFFHARQVEGMAFADLTEGMSVQFDRDAESPRGPRASRVVVQRG